MFRKYPPINARIDQSSNPRAWIVSSHHQLKGTILGKSLTINTATTKIALIEKEKSWRYHSLANWS